MSIFADAHVTLFLADYASTDAAGKVNALGVGFALSGVQGNGFTAPQYVVGLVDVPSRYADQEFSLSLELRNDDTNQIVTLPPGPSGQREALRFQQLSKVEPPRFAGVYVPSSMYARVQVILAFQQGLILQPGVTYRWCLGIDGQSRAGWTARFHVAGPPPGPVVGGPADISVLDDLPPFPTDEDDPPSR